MNKTKEYWCWCHGRWYSSSPCSLKLIQNYFSVMEQCFPLIIFQHKHQHKSNFSINEQLSKERRIRVTNLPTILLPDALFTHITYPGHQGLLSAVFRTWTGTRSHFGLTLKVLLPQIPRGFQDSELHRHGGNAYWWFDEWLSDLIREQRCTRSQSWHSVAVLPLGRLNVQAQVPGNPEQECKYLTGKKKEKERLRIWHRESDYGNLN